MSVRRIFHLTAVVADIDAAVRSGEVLGATVLFRVSDVINGVEMHRAMLWIGDTLLEAMEPIGSSPFQSFLERFGGGLSVIGVEVADAARARAELAAHQVEVAVDFEPELWATRPSTTAGLALQWSGRPVPDDPRDGTIPPPSPRALIPVRRLAAALAVVDDPVAAGERLGDVLGTAVTPLGQDDAGRPVVGVGLGDGTLVLSATGDGGPWPSVQTRPRLLGLAVEVVDVPAAQAVLTAHGMAITGQHLLGPVLTGGGSPWPVVLTDGLPACDDRGGP